MKLETEFVIITNLCLICLLMALSLFHQVELMKIWIKKMFGENPQQLKTIARIVNKQHFFRLKNLLVDHPGVKESVVYGGSVDEDNL